MQRTGHNNPIDPDKVIQMYDVDLLTIRDIAKRLGISYGTVQRIVSTHTTPRSIGHRARSNEELAPCGTKRAYQRHIDRGEQPDELCKQANRDYTNSFNRRTGTGRARNRAYRRLSRTFPDVFNSLLVEEQGRAEGERPGEPTKVWRGRARERAYRRLVSIYPEVFQQIFEDEKTIAKSEARDDVRPPS